MLESQILVSLSYTRLTLVVEIKLLKINQTSKGWQENIYVCIQISIL